MIESEALLAGQRWHRQRLHLVLTAMRRYAAALRERGFEVDYRRAASFRVGLAAHRREHQPPEVRAAEPMTHGLRRTLEALGVRLLRHERFLLHYEDFAAWATGYGHKRGPQPRAATGLRMDAFYRARRVSTGYLMEGGQPAGHSFSFDVENREPASRAPRQWPPPLRDALDALDHAVIAELDAWPVFGAPPDGTWATSREGALRRLAHFIDECLPRFGPHQDVMLHDAWHMAHSLLSPYLNLALLHPREVCDAIQHAYESGHVPLASAEGFLRQVLGWREYIWGTYWLFGPEYAHSNALDAQRELLPLYHDPSRTHMQCVRDALGSIEQHAYAHHIQRLMVLGNLALLAGVRPLELARFMQVSFIDGGEWVMWPNVLGMGLFADGGRMSTKPYAAGGAYVHRMSDACGRCRYRPTERTGERACPLTTLYWAFFARHRQQLTGNPRVRNALIGLERLRDRDAVLAHANDVLRGLSRGEV
ncbi:MAG: cryptochrome/photolyase family protein, partial [Polyangiales bacterium]